MGQCIVLDKDVAGKKWFLVRRVGWKDRSLEIVSRERRMGKHTCAFSLPESEGNNPTALRTECSRAKSEYFDREVKANLQTQLRLLFFLQMDSLIRAYTVSIPSHIHHLDKLLR